MSKDKCLHVVAGIQSYVDKRDGSTAILNDIYT